MTISSRRLRKVGISRHIRVDEGFSLKGVQRGPANLMIHLGNHAVPTYSAGNLPFVKSVKSGIAIKVVSGYPAHPPRMKQLRVGDIVGSLRTNVYVSPEDVTHVIVLSPRKTQPIEMMHLPGSAAPPEHRVEEPVEPEQDWAPEKDVLSTPGVAEALKEALDELDEWEKDL
jgi:hypothetical protein